MISTRLAALLDRRAVFIALLIGTGFVTLAMMWATRHVMLSDAWSYIALAEGILHGEYSMWWPLEGHYPDTFRAPGYPLLVAAVMAITGTWAMLSRSSARTVSWSRPTTSSTGRKIMVLWKDLHPTTPISRV